MVFKDEVLVESHGLLANDYRSRGDIPATAPVGSTGAERAAALVLRASWDKRWDRAAAILITSISDDEIHTVQAVDEDPVQIWDRLREKFER